MRNLKNGHVPSKRQDSPKKSPARLASHLTHQDVEEIAWDFNIPLPKLTLRAAASVVFFTAAGCFFLSSYGGFVFDDNEAIIGNVDITPAMPIGDIFAHDFWGSRLNSTFSHKSYRPLTVLTFRLNYYLSGGLAPWGFHFTNVLLHGVVCSLLLLTISTLLNDKAWWEGSPMTFNAAQATLLTSVLFAVHPIHTESVSGIVGRADLMCAITFLTSVLAYIQSCHTGDGESVTPAMLIWTFTSMVLCSISVLFKEQGITALGICSAYDVIIACRIDLLRLIGLKKKLTPAPDPNANTAESKYVESQPTPWMKCLVLRHIIIFITGALILIIRWRVMGSATPTFQVMDNPHSFVNGTVLRSLNYNYLYAINFLLLLAPWWLCFDWSMGCIPVIESVSDPRVLAVVIFWAGFAAFLCHCLWTESTPETRLLIMSLAFLIIPFLPATNVLFRVGFVVAERNLYLPSIGFCLMVALGVNKICRIQKYRKIVSILLPALMVLFAARSLQRSLDWADEKTLFESGEAVCPLNAKVHYNIAKTHGDLGNVDYAIEKYRRAIELHPKYDQAMNNLANILKEKNELLEAEELLEGAVKIRPTFAAAWMNLGIVQAGLKKSEAAELSYFNALLHRRNYPDCYFNLGNLYLDLKQNTQALIAWTNATKLKPTHVNAWSNALILLDNLGRLEDAIYIGQQALQHLPNDPQINYQMANIYGKKEKYRESERHFLRAIQVKDTALFQTNLGVLYHRWGKYSKAEKAYVRSLELDSSLQNSAHEYLGMVRKKLKKKAG
ncbi:protein O-mannosyl-transferase TMTC4-like [Lineus longissimus]|uniref:protein O-mannosyl-transferase TMTC4-like n=1 Tax=Lineus longissimus TaxID=88925 RepID=UPI002B4D646B